MTGYFLTVWVLCIAAGAMLGSMRGSTAFGFFWPFFLGPLGLLLAFVLLKDEEPKTAKATHDASR